MPRRARDGAGGASSPSEPAAVLSGNSPPRFGRFDEIDRLDAIDKVGRPDDPTVSQTRFRRFCRFCRLRRSVCPMPQPAKRHRARPAVLRSFRPVVVRPHGGEEPPNSGRSTTGPQDSRTTVSFFDLRLPTSDVRDPGCRASAVERRTGGAEHAAGRGAQNSAPSANSA